MRQRPHVEIDIAGGATVTALITNEAVDELKLAIQIQRTRVRRRGRTIAPSIAFLGKVEGPTLFARGLGCLEKTPLPDLKPDRPLFVPPAPPTPGDSDIG